MTLDQMVVSYRVLTETRVTAVPTKWTGTLDRWSCTGHTQLEQQIWTKRERVSKSSLFSMAAF